jgi:hypothetical protein
MKKLERAIGKAWKHTLSYCCVCLFSTSYKNKNTILYRVSIKILGFQHTFFKQPSLEARFKTQFHHLFTQNTFLTQTCCRVEWR